MKTTGKFLAAGCGLMLLSACSLFAQESQIVFLSGTGVDNTKTWKFKCTDGQKAGKWGKIEVPSQWELQGYGEYTYGRWYTDKSIKSPSTEEGFYEYSFNAPKAWNGQKVTIWFDGVMTDAEVYVNGQKAGEMHQGGFYRFGYDISSLLVMGKKNKLEVHVYKHSANKSINAAERKADWWLFGGIYRPVWLEVAPETNIQHLAVDARADGLVYADVALSGDVQGYTLSASVKSLDGSTVVGEMSPKVISTETQNAATQCAVKQNIAFNCKDMKLWNCEDPNLYVLTVKLNDKSGKTIHSKDVRIGFRTIDFKPKDGLYLNGTKLIVKGINRHSFSVDGGRTTSKALSIMDAKLIKGMNMNAVRSHYPPDEHFLDACDSLGILYMDELAGWQNGYDNVVGPKLVGEMIRRDVNHPSIFIWSNGNEGGWNTNLDNLFAQYDPQNRHVVHPWADFNQLDTHHYPAYLTGVARFNNGYNVFMPTEFMHAMYDQGGGAGLADFWNKWTTSPLFAGGFIWVYCDEAPMRSDKGGILDSDKSNAPDGVVGPRREKEGSYYAIREVWSPIQIKPLQITSSFDGRIFVSNSYLFTSLEGCKLNYQLLKCPSPMSVQSKSRQSNLVGRGSITLADIKPGETRSVQLPEMPMLQEADVMTLEAINAQGDTVCNWSYPVHYAKDYLGRQLQAYMENGMYAGISSSANESASAKAHVCEAKKENGVVILRNDTAEVQFDDKNGQILSIKVGGKDIPFNNGPVSVGMKMKYMADKSYVGTEKASWTTDGLSAQGVGTDEGIMPLSAATNNESDKQTLVYVAKYQGGVDSIVWKLTPDGLLAMDAVMLNRAGGGGGFDDAFMDTEVKNLGLTFSYPEAECTGMKWLGRGPYRVWKNRLPGTNYDVWHKDYNNTITGESYENLVYPEFKGYHANLYWATIESKTSPFTVYSQSDGIYFRVFTPEEPKGRADGKATMPAFPEGDLSFLLDIPAIQSFKPISQQGPQSQPGNIRIKKGDAGIRINLLFDFR